MDLSEHPRLSCITSKFNVVINNTPFTIGRGINCDYIIPNQVISRIHCQFEKNGSQWFLRDRSTNGTFLNGVLIKLDISPPLKDTDVIQLSDDSYKYIFQCKCTTSRDDISDEQLCRIADSVLENLEVSTEPVPNTSHSIINISDTSVQINTESSSPRSYSQPSKKIKVSPSIIDLTDENYKYEIDAPSTSNTNQAQVIDLSDSFPLPINIDSNMVVQSDLEDEHEIVIELASTSSACSNMGQEDSQRPVEEKLKDDTESQEDLLCAICSEMFVKATTLNCSHTFCKFCIETWKKKQKFCPICRAKMTTEVGTLVLDNYIERIIQTSAQDVRERRKELLEERKKSEQINKNTIPKAPGFLFLEDGGTTVSDTSDDSEEDDDDDDLDDDYDVWSQHTPYYGGYGNCFSCGRRGHWASGCPYR